MRKIPTVFVRDFDARPALVTNQVTPGCEWVLEGHGAPTRKWDGICVMLDTDGAWWARREVKPGKTSPVDYVPLSTDEETGRTVGWEPVGQSAFAKFHAEAIANTGVDTPGTYELIGPKINGSPDGWDAHVLMPHGWAPLAERLDIEKTPRDYDGLRAWLLDRPYEGIVWHHEDGRMAKLKGRDFR
jgi:hypothetical protein